MWRMHPDTGKLEVRCAYGVDDWRVLEDGFSQAAFLRIMQSCVDANLKKIWYNTLHISLSTDKKDQDDHDDDAGRDEFVGVTSALDKHVSQFIQ